MKGCKTCDNFAQRDGLCMTCWRKANPDRTCLQGCPRPEYSGGLCWTCYRETHPEESPISFPLPKEPIFNLTEFTPQPWAKEAACREVEDPDIFFADKGRGAAQPAKQVCADCPVRKDCAEYAIPDASLVGIWGGLTEPERRAIRVQRRKEAS